MRHLSNPHPVSKYLLRVALGAMALTGVLLSGCVTGNPPKPVPYLREQGDFFMQAGIESYAQFNFVLATEQFNQAKNFYGRFDDFLGTTNALLNLAQTSLAQGKFDAAAQYLSRAEPLIQRHDSTQQAIYRDMLLTSLYIAADKLADAEKIFATHDTMLRGKLDDKVRLNLLINRVRYAQITQQDFSLWLGILIQQSSTQTNTDITARINRFNAAQAFFANDTAQGNRLFESALTVYREQADPTGLMATQLEWGQACAKAGDWTAATEHYELAVNLAMLNSHIHNGLRALDGLREAFQQTGQTDKQAQIDDWTKQLKSIPATGEQQH